MQQNAVVKELLPDNKARVLIQRQTACGHDCTKCGGCGEMYTKPIFVELDNSIDARVGDVVKIEGSTKNILALAAIVYIMPFVLFFLFYGISSSVGSSIPGVFGIIGLAAGILCAKMLNNYHKKHSKTEYVMSRV